MGTLNQTPPPSDLKVNIQHSSLVFPSQETERKSMFLSNIDQVLNFDVQTVHFFPFHPEFTHEMVADRLRDALSKVLVAYDFLAGRLKMNAEVGRLEIDCNREGAVFVVASSEYSLDDIGDLVYPNPAFRQLVVQSTLDINNSGEQPLLLLQVTSFKCGGFAMGISNNHATFDGLSFKLFLDNLASQAYHNENSSLRIPPCNDRHLLAARSPPRVIFPHPELLKLSANDDQQTTPPPVFTCHEEDLDFKIFKLTPDDLSSLKENAKKTTANNNNSKIIKISGFSVVTAHVWRCKALSYGGGEEEENNLKRESTVLYAVDIRSRLCPPLPRAYAGNAVLTAYATADCKTLKEGPLSKLMEMVGEGAMRMTDEYARSAIDWGEVYKGFPNGEFLVSSWWKLGFSQVEYPWGKPRYSCPVVYHRKDIILLFPDMNNDEGVNVLVALPPKEMQAFTTLFHHYLGSLN